MTEKEGKGEGNMTVYWQEEAKYLKKQIQTTLFQLTKKYSSCKVIFRQKYSVNKFCASQIWRSGLGLLGNNSAFW